MSYELSVSDSEYGRIVLSSSDVSLSHKVNSMFSMREFLPKVKKYFRENFGAPFIVGFQVFLLVAAGFLVVGNSALANDVAVFAYYLLVVGVVLQLFSFLKYRRQEQ